MKHLASLALLLLLTACASAGPPPSPEAQIAAASDIAEVVFRYQFQHNASTLQQGAERFCLLLPDERSPDEAFLRRFDGNSPPVVAGSRCERKAAGDLFFRVQRLDWQGDDEVWVRGGYSEGTLRSSVESFRVLRRNGRWTVEGARRES
ncbi:MAG TPA: hypothetical protein VGG20_10820 [Thermoanaerobaculia bacterium]